MSEQGRRMLAGRLLRAVGAVLAVDRASRERVGHARPRHVVC